MKKYLWIWMAVLATLQAQGQVSMTVQLPPTGVLQKAQLWNILLVSASNAPVNVRIMLRLSDAATNQPLLTGISRTITLAKGARQLQLADVNPVQYEYLSPAVDRTTNGLLTSGNYVACYSVVAGSHVTELAAEDCIPFTVEPVSPPLLNTPANESVLETLLPQFTWLPPAPLNIFNDLNYELVIVAIGDGQSAPEAIQQNMPVFRAPNNRNLFVNYPASAAALDTARRYAWTVTAYNGNRFAAQTEVWTFRIKNMQSQSRRVINAYVQLKKELTGYVTGCSGPLLFSYNNEANDRTVKYEIVALERNNRIVQQGELSLKPGENMVELQLERSTRFDDKKTYLFRLLNSRQEHWNIKFIYNSEKDQQ
jgi:hypothetical protein